MIQEKKIENLFGSRDKNCKVGHEPADNYLKGT